MRIDGWLLIPILISFGQSAQAEVTFGSREKVPGVNSSSANETAMTAFVLPDHQTEFMVFSRSPNGGGFHDFWQSSRSVPDGEWSSPVLLGIEGGIGWFEDTPHANADGLTLLLTDGVWFDDFSPHRPNGFGQADIWIATRETTEDNFGAPENMGETINSRYYDGGATLSADGLTLLFDSSRPDGRVGGVDLWMASRDGPDMPWNDPVNLGETINSSRNDIHPAISPDGRRLFFSSDRSGNYDIWMSTRDTPSDPWNSPVQLDESVNHPVYMEAAPSLSTDGSTLYLTANLSSSPYVLSWDIYEVPILNPVTGDFNDDGALSVTDIDALTTMIIDESDDARFDLNEDGNVDRIDHAFWVKELKGTWLGDANLDGEFNSGDMVEVFQAGTYELDADAGWAEGDWNTDQRFDSGDLVAAFQDGGYEQGPRAALNAVPEPSCAVLLAIGVVGLFRFRKRRSHGRP